MTAGRHGAISSFASILPRCVSRPSLAKDVSGVPDEYASPVVEVFGQDALRQAIVISASKQRAGSVEFDVGLDEETGLQ